MIGVFVGLFLISSPFYVASKEVGRVKRFDWQDDGRVYWSMNCDFFGGDLREVKGPGEQCGPSCASTDGCKAFTWTNQDGGTCYMKSQGFSREQATYLESAVCGLRKGGGPEPGGDCRSSDGQNCVQFVNQCDHPVWVGILGQHPIPDQGGFKLDAGQRRNSFFGATWQGRMWGRTSCDGGGHCKTGDCGNKIQCNGAGGVPPATLAEIKFRGHGNQDYYDISLVDGYNLRMRFGPIEGTYRGGASGYTCTEANCMTDINNICPDELKLRDGNRVVGCKSACLALNRPEFCCSGAHNTPQTCPPFSYSQMFKNACPKAYSYAYDDVKSTFTCRGNGAPSPSYRITFC